MKQVIALKDVTGLKASGAKTFTAPADAIVTPSAKDFLRSIGVTIQFDGASTAGNGNGSSAPAAAAEPKWKPEHVKLFNSPEAQRIKEHIVSVSHRLWKREYVDGNGGNVSYRIGPNEVLCTPTLVSKGIMRVEDICMVDLAGNQIAGTAKRTSEIFLHLEAMKAQPKARACVHAHPPHATAFAITGAEVPRCMIPEMEVLVGTVAKAKYETPGTQAFAETVLPYCKDHNCILLQNHGVLTWNEDLEKAYWFMEIVDAYCRTVVIASHLGSAFTQIPSSKIGDLLKIKQGLGLPDERTGLKEADYCACEFRPGVVCSNANESSPSGPDLEAIVKIVTEEVVKALSK
ncbi:MAG: class II aldolase/adducin family protein [Verrucomicrobia bacterium]|nr:class II aldolase/adducin family protein [Verrucomicrobiota bacterium]